MARVQGGCPMMPFTAKAFILEVARPRKKGECWGDGDVSQP